MKKGKQYNNFFAAVLHEFPMLLTIVVAGLGFLMITGLKGCSRQAGDVGESSAVVTPSESEPAGSTEADSVETQPVISSEEVPSTETVPSETPSTEPETTAPVTTEEPGPVYPEGFTTVDETYFADALFIGDSRTDGLCLYSPVGQAKHYSGTSMTIFKIMSATDAAYGYNSIRDLLKNMQFGKIYIMFGINEAGYDTDYFFNAYKEVIEEIRSYQPDAIIYIQSILYVTQKHEKNNPVFSSDGLKEKNARLQELANGVDIFYLEVNDALNDGTDHLPSDYTGDGVHLKASYYKLWKQYLLEHAIVNADHPWEEPTEETEP